MPAVCHGTPQGVPLREPAARYRPFVMNTPALIHQAFAGWEADRIGAIERQ